MQSEKCAYCGDLTDMPFQCNYCKDPFCAEHRLPEEHRCVKLSQIRAKRFGSRRLMISSEELNRVLSEVKSVKYRRDVK